MTEATYAYYPVFRCPRGLGDIGTAGREMAVQEVQELLAKFADRVQVRGVYSGVGFRPDADLFFWWIAPRADDVQELAVALRQTTLGRALQLTHAFLGVVRPPEFNPEHRPAFLRGEPPRRYLSVYPFVRTAEWYLLPPERRAELLREHGEMGREFPDVLPNTTAGFGLGDWEWILAFESDSLVRIVDCIRRLREAQARRFTKLDVPFVLGIRKDLAEAVADLG